MQNEKTPIRFLEYHITHRCNYRCEYCYEKGVREVDFTDSPDDIVDAFIDLVSKLEGSWLIKLIGGEPLIHPRFFEMVEAISKNGHRLSINTNFSFPLSHFRRILEIDKDAFKECMISLHLSQANVDDFIPKVIQFNKEVCSDCRLVVCSVVTEENFDRLKEIAQKLLSNGVKFKYQNFINTDGVRIIYSDRIEEYLKNEKNAIVDETFRLKRHKSFGTLCNTGHLSFYIYKNGYVRRCYVNQGSLEILGNIKEGFELFKAPMPCMAEYCTCSQPFERNLLIPNKYDIPKAYFYKHLYKNENFANRIANISTCLVPSKKMRREIREKIKSYLV